MKCFSKPNAETLPRLPSPATQAVGGQASPLPTREGIICVRVLFILFIFTALFGFSQKTEAQTQTLNCCVKKQTREDFITHEQKPIGEPACRLNDSSQGTQPCAGQEKCGFDRGSGGLKVCTEELSVPCTNEPNACRGVLESTLVGCTTKDHPDCDKAPASCLWFGNSCRSLYDQRVCPEIRDSAVCGKFQACGWENNQCVTGLQSAINSRYDTSKQGRGEFLEPCAITGSCRDTNDILRLLLNIVSYAMKFIGVLAFVMFVAGGVVMVASFGNPEQFKKGQQMLVYAIIGIVVSLSAVLIVKFVLDAIGVTGGFRVI